MLRSIRKAYEIIKEQDKDTSITIHSIRVWCKEGKIKSLNAGTKVLADMESLLDYISLKNWKGG